MAGAEEGLISKDITVSLALLVPNLLASVSHRYEMGIIIRFFKGLSEVSDFEAERFSWMLTTF